MHNCADRGRSSFAYAEMIGHAKEWKKASRFPQLTLLLYGTVGSLRLQQSVENG